MQILRLSKQGDRLRIYYDLGNHRITKFVVEDDVYNLAFANLKERVADFINSLSPFYGSHFTIEFSDEAVKIQTDKSTEIFEDLKALKKYNSRIFDYEMTFYDDIHTEWLHRHAKELRDKT